MSATKVISAVVHAAIALTVFLVWYFIALNAPKRGLSWANLADSLKWFTTLSNLLQGIASLVMVIALLCGFDQALWLKALRWAAATSVGVTFFTVLLFLGPSQGYQGFYDDSGLYYHLIVPLAAMLAFVLLDRGGGLPWGYILIALAPFVLYGLGYSLNLIVNGFGPSRYAHDLYGFAQHGAKSVVISIAGMTTLAAGTAALLRLLRGA